MWARWYRRCRLFIFQAHFTHFLRNNLEGDDQIGENHLTDFLPLVDMKALGIYDAHLLQDGRFARLPSTYNVVDQIYSAQRSRNQPNSRIFTCLACSFLSFRIILSISIFLFLSSLVSRARGFPTGFGKHMLKTIAGRSLAIVLW